MARTDTLGNFLSDVADAIREKKGTSDLISASDFDTEIANLPSGSGLDWSAIGYSEEPQAIEDGYNYSKDIYDNWDLNNPYKFQNDSKLVFLPLIDTSNVSDAEGFFSGCSMLIEVPSIIINGSNITTSTIREMFRNCTNLKYVDLSNFNISNIIYMQNMFNGCVNLEEIDMSSLNTSNVQYMQNMFTNCSKLKTINFGSNFKMTSVVNVSSIFSGCNSLDDNTLDKILEICVTATSYTGTKTLARLGITDTTIYPTSRIQALSHYQDFINAGWTIGY